MCVLYIPHSRFAVEPVLFLIDDVFGLAESVDIDNHNLNVGADRELAHIRKPVRAVYKIAVRDIIVSLTEIFLGSVKRFLYSLPNGHAGDNDDKFCETIPTV